MTVKTVRWDSAEYLQTDEDIAAYLDAVLGEDDPALVTHALGIIARAKGMSQLARETGLGRESLDQALSAEGNPERFILKGKPGALKMRPIWREVMTL